MGHTGIRRESTGVLPVLQAYVEQNRRFDIDSLEDTAFTTALDGGAGSILSYVTAESETFTRSARSGEVQAAELTMRLVTAVILETVEKIIATARQEGIEVMLLKGCASALRYHPEPHLRTMGDVDVLVSGRNASRWSDGCAKWDSCSPAILARPSFAIIITAFRSDILRTVSTSRFTRGPTPPIRRSSARGLFRTTRSPCGRNRLPSVRSRRA